MHTSRDSRTRPRWALALLGGAVALTVAVLGQPAVAYAAPHAQAPTASASGKASVTAACAEPAKGFASCYALRRDDIVGVKGLQPLDVTPQGFGAGDLQSAYNLPANGGAGATVAIIDAFDDPNAESDLAVYRQQFGLPACTTANGCFRKVDQRGGTDYPAPDTGWAGEISLDVDMVSAAAPAAHILLVEADDNSFDNLAAAVDQAVAMGAKYVSNSYGTSYSSSPGSGEPPTEATEFDPHYNHPGVAMVASSGDDDFGVSYPAVSPYVTSVGGTSLATASNARGWTESVWHNSFGGPGSGCSVFEAKPDFQTDSGCANRTVADVSAVADPVTGVSVYQTFGFTGWAVYGGTSASSPLIAGVYAVAGTPVAGTYPNSYPYANAGALNDVTTGLNGTCSPAYLCTAGPGYDGPTGLGTPNGPAAFTTGPHGTITGLVTDSVGAAPIGGATVTAGTTSGTTDATGHYTISVPVGTVDVTFSAYGYGSVTIPNVTVGAGATVTENATLTALPSASVTGAITDGSGHGWPLYARITVDGVPGGPVYTDPGTGHYALTLPQSQTYHLHVTPVYGGYTNVDQTVNLGTTNTQVNVAVPVDVQACNAPGYTVHFNGTTEAFNGTTTPAGWTVDNGTGSGGWAFADLGARGNLTGGTGGFAIADSDHLGAGNSQNTTLTAPAATFAAGSNPSVSFDTDYRGFSNQVGRVELSLDSGVTWSTLWEHLSDSFRGPAHVDVAVPQAAGKSGVLIRFHFISSFGWWWELDNVFVGSRTCDPVHGGLVFGLVTDKNTGSGVNGAEVTSADSSAIHATTAATPDDPNLGDGFYWLFSPLTGRHPFTVTKARYTAVTGTVNVAVDFATRFDAALKAGQILVTPTTVDKTVAWQGTATATVTLKNTGTAPATVDLSEQNGSFQLLTQGGAPLHRVTGTFSKHSLHSGSTTAKPGATTATPKDVTPSAAPWTSIADYPVLIQDNVAAVNDGKLYSGFGFNGSDDVSSLYAFDPGTGAWTALASASATREKPAAAFINGKLYVAGGWGVTGAPLAAMEVYDPATNAWTAGVATPKPYAGSGVAVLNDKLYVVGGCDGSACGKNDVEVFDPAAGTWTAAAAYPEMTAWESCGAISGQLYCSGGTTDAGSTTHTYAYDPGTNAWSPRANMPADLWGSAYVAANGMLLVSGGVTAAGSSITNQGYAYDPTTDAWTALPNANQSVYRGASACGFYQIGGSAGGLFTPPVATSEVLPGFADCGSSGDVPWLSESATHVTLAAGTSAKITLTLNANVDSITQPGTYTAKIGVRTDTPYSATPIAVSMLVNPPKTWGKITGTVTSAVDGKAIPGATVQIDSWATSYTLKTDKDGKYALWLDQRNNPLQLICAKDGFQPQTIKVRITKGTTTTVNFSLKKA